VDRLLAEEDQAATVEQEQAKHQVKYQTPQNPMVFCHGLLGFDYLGPDSLPALQINHWRGIREVLEANGVEVMIARVPATSSIKDRAAILRGLISERYPGRKVNLVAHSMGGLDCRYLIHDLAQAEDPEFKVSSLTTVSTPHRGSPFADYVIDNVIGRDRLPQLLGIMEAMRLPDISGDGTAFAALGTRAMAEFNNEVVDDPDVKYYSWGASFEAGLFDTFRWPWSVIMAKEGPNDGLVSVSSAKWGEYRGTVLDVNHLDL
jgi:triacylglycerol lipase